MFVKKSYFAWVGLLGLVLTVTCVWAKDCAPLPGGIVSWWPAEGDATDIIGGNDGTLIGDVTFDDGMVGQGFRINNGPFVDVPATSSLNLSAVTIEGWISMDTLPSGTDFVGVTKGITPSSENYSLYIRGTELLFEWFNGGFRQVTSTGSGLTAGAFYHVAATADGANINFYVNGRPVGQVAQVAPLLPNSSNLQIGSAQPAYSNRFVGVIDELSIYNRALNATEIQSIFAAGTAGKCLPE